MPELTMKSVQLAESHVLLPASATISSPDDDTGWNRRGGESVVLEDYQRDRAVEAAEKLFYSSPLAHRMIEQWADFVVGDKGFDLTSSNEEARVVLADFWHSLLNNIPSRLYDFVQEYFLYGEMCFMAKTHDDGFVAVTYVPSAEIADVLPREGEPGVPARVILASGQEADVISWNNTNQRLEGDCFYFKAGHLGSSVRGFPCLIPLVDFLRAWEMFVYEYLKRRALYDAIWWDVTLEGFNQDQIQDWLSGKNAQPPQAGSVFAHNERVDWKLTQSDFRRSALSDDGDFYVELLLGTSGLADLSPTPASRQRDRGEVLDPTARSLSSRQYRVRSYFVLMGEYVVQEAIAAGKLGVGDYPVRCSAPRLGVRDFQRSSGALQRFTTALVQAEESGWIIQDDASKLFNDMLVQLGMTEEG